jgi:predicted dehydrogenase
MKNIRYGFIGLNHGKDHIGVVDAIAGAEVGALCDLNSELTAKYAQEFSLSAQQCYESVDAMINDASLDVIVVATPVHTHKDIALKALQSGKHLFLEKPLAHTLEDARAIIEATEQSNAVTQIGYCVRSSPLVSKLRSVRDAGQIGDIALMLFNMILPHEEDACSWRADRAKSGGKLFDCCCHYLDIMFHLAQSRFSRVCAFGGPLGHVGVNESDIPAVANLIIEMENGIKITLNLSEETPCNGYSNFDIAGTRGRIKVCLDDAGSFEMASEGNLFHEKVTVNTEMASAGHLGFAEQHRFFFDAITKNSPVICTPEDAMEIVYLNMAIDRSLATGRVVSAEEIRES